MPEPRFSTAATTEALDESPCEAQPGTKPSQRKMVDGLRHQQSGKRTDSSRVKVADDHTRESLAMEVDTSLASERVVRALDGAIQQLGR